MRDLNLKNPFFVAAVFFAVCALDLAPAFGASPEQLEKENSVLKKQLETVTSDRDNVLKQAKNFLREKEEAIVKLEALKKSGEQVHISTDAAVKENAILKSDIQRIIQSREKDAALFKKEKADLEARIADLHARTDSLVQAQKEFPVEKIKEMIANQNRLEEENKQLANKLIENDKVMQEFKRQMKPYELDREELNRLRTEHKEMLKRMKYVRELEERQKQLVKENAENREKVEVLKAKFKESVPGLAKAGRISQKMMRENADMHYNLGTIFLQNKQYKEAIREYEQVLELRPNDPETHYNLGVLYDDYVRDREKALYHYQKYLSVNPKAPDAKKVETYVLNLELEQKVR